MTGTIFNAASFNINEVLNQFENDEIKSNINAYWNYVKQEDLSGELSLEIVPDLYRVYLLYVYIGETYPSYSIVVPPQVIDFELAMKNDLVTSVTPHERPDMSNANGFLGSSPVPVTSLIRTRISTSIEAHAGMGPDSDVSQPPKRKLLGASVSIKKVRVELQPTDAVSQPIYIPVHVATNRDNILSNNGMPLNAFKYKTIPVLVDQAVTGCPNLVPSSDINDGFTSDLHSFLQSIQHIDGDTALIFIHGFNTHFLNVLYYAAKARSIYGIPGDTFAFDWACAAESAASYLEMAKRISNKLYPESLISFITSIMENKQYRKVIIVAHSMGNRLFFQSLIYKNWRIANHPDLNKLQILLFAANCSKSDVENKFKEVSTINSGIFSDDLNSFPDDLNHYNLNITNVFSKSDKALLARELTSQKQLGRYQMEVGSEKCVVNSFEFKGTSWDSIGHSYVLNRDAWETANIIKKGGVDLFALPKEAEQLCMRETLSATYETMKNLPVRFSA